jgi:hypothetical protein
MTASLAPFQQAIQKARQAFRLGDHVSTRYWAQKAAQLAPDQEEPWLWLAYVATPRASINYIQRALHNNPNSPRARQAMHWAVKRLRTSQVISDIHLAATQPLKPAVFISATPTQPVPRRIPTARRSLPWLTAALIILIAVAIPGGCP